MVCVLLLCLLACAPSAGARAGRRGSETAVSESLTQMPDAPISADAASAFGSPFAAVSAPVMPAMARHARAKQPKLSARASHQMEQAYKRQQAARRRALRTPAARHARARSRTAYRRLSRGAALAAMRLEAPKVTVRPSWRPPSLAPGTKVVAYSSATTMVVDQPGTRGHTIVESSWPLLARNARGAVAPIDLTLHPGGDGWAPANAPLSELIGETLGSGVRLGSGAGALTVRPGGAQRAAGVQSANKVFYANSAPDTDTIVDPTPTGISLDWTLRSPAAPEQTSFTLDLPAGVTLRRDGDGIVLVQDGRVVGSVSAPLAWDAQNTQVPVSYAISGATITVTTRHHGRDLEYPVSVDPVVSTPGGALASGETTTPSSGWMYGTAAGYEPYFTGSNDGTTMRIDVAATLPSGSAAWMLGRSNAYISQVQFPSVQFRAANGVCMLAGLWNWAASNPASETGWAGELNGPSANGMYGNCTGFGPLAIRACVVPGCDGNSGSTNDAAGVQTWISGVSGPGAALLFNGAYIYWGDHDNPTMSYSGPVGTWSTNNHPGVAVHLHDAGLGVGKDTGHADPRPLVKVLYDGNGTTQSTETSGVPTCEGTLSSPCPADAYPTETLSSIPDGVHTLHVYGRDILNHTIESDQTVQIDTHAPDVTSAARLANLSRSTSSGVLRSVSKPIRLTASASDAVAGISTSGVRSLTLTIRQGTVSSTIQGTSQSDGTYKFDYLFNPVGWSPGEVDFSVSAVDNAGNVSTAQRFSLEVGRGALTSLIEGQQTAKRLILQAQDLLPPSLSPATSVHFQYRTAGKSSAWADIPASQLQNIDGTSAGANAFAVSASTHLSPKVIWDVADALPGVTVPIYVRGWFSSTDGDVTNDVKTGIDPSGLSTDDNTTKIGPGAVDEITGNFSMSSQDVSVAAFKTALGITRTYNSRTDLSATPGPFGPGWTLGTAAKADGALYTKVINYSETGQSDPDDAFLGAAEVQMSDGTQVPFQEHNNDNGYDALPQLDNLQLVRQADGTGRTTSFTMTDRDTGETLTFDRTDATQPGVYTLGSVQEPSSSHSMTFRYQASANGLQVSDAVAPSTVDCTGTSFTTTVGCRSLHFTYNSSNRLTEIDLVAPGTGLTGNQVAVARYDYDSSGRLADAYDPRQGATLATSYTYNSDGRLATITPPGENAWTLGYGGLSGESGGTTTGRLRSVTRSQPVGSAGTPTNATVTVAYNVALSGSGAPYDMSASTLAGWHQVDDIPTDATALFRPDDVPANPPSSYAKATIHYLDALGRMTDEVRPGGETDTIEHDAAGNVTRSLSASNRAAALATGTTSADHAARADVLSTVSTYGEASSSPDTGWRTLSVLGPIHATQLADGTTVQARRHTVYTYGVTDTGSAALNLPTETVESALTTGGADVDARTTDHTYDATSGETLTTTVDPSGLHLVSRNEYNGDGLPTYQEHPRSNSETAASTRHTIYYSAGTAEDSACSNRAAWAGLACKVTTGGATTGSLPSLPVSVFEYDAYDHETKRTDYVDGVSRRVQVDGYSGDRHTSEQITGTTGDARPEVDYGYSATTGRLLTTTSQSSPARVITRAYNPVGDIASYTDADGGTTTTVYDVDGRPTSVTDPSGTESYNYDATTGRVSSMTDAAIGQITPAWTADGDLGSELFATANVKLGFTHDETGTVTGRSYVDQSPCSSNCTVYSDSATRSIHDQWLSESGTDKARTYVYDAAGRLSSSTDRPAGGSCTTKAYTYDADGDRLTRRTYPAGTGGACSTSTTPTTQTLTYDEADRLNTTGYVYDTLGRITTVPAGDAGGANALTTSYYLDDRAHTLTQGGTTTTLDLDPDARVRQRTVGTGTPTVSHYGDESDDPAWTAQGGTVVHNSMDLSGDLVATVGPSSGGGSGTWTAPTTSVLDNFNRANGSLGSNWSLLTGTAASSISSNQVSVGTPYGYEWWNANSYTGEGEVYMTVPAVSTTTNDQFYIDMDSGWSTGNLNGYELTLTRGGTVDNFQLSKYTNGAESAIGSAVNLSGHFGAGDKIALTRQAGGRIRMWREASGSSTWTQVGATITDTSYFDGGQSWQIGFGAGSAPYRIDDFGGGQITSSSGAGSPKLNISDLHGDVVSTVPNASGGALTLLNPVDAFGAPTTAAGANLGAGYVGAASRNTVLSAGTVEMGQRLYQPQIGRFLQADPVFGGSANTYDYGNQDPANEDDLSGQAGGPGGACGMQHSCGYYTDQFCRKNPRNCQGSRKLGSCLVWGFGGVIVSKLVGGVVGCAAAAITTHGAMSTSGLDILQSWGWYGGGDDGGDDGGSSPAAAAPTITLTPLVPMSAIAQMTWATPDWGWWGS